MGETDEKENIPTSEQQQEQQHQQQEQQQQQQPDNIEDAKETDKMLNKTNMDENKKNEKNDTIIVVDDKLKKLNGEEIVNADNVPQQMTLPPSNTETVSSPQTGGGANRVPAQEREVKPRKIPIGAIKMPGYFTRNKNNGKNNGDGRGDGTEEGELLENAGNEAKLAEKEKPKSTQSGGGFLASLRLKNPFKKQPKQEDEENVVKDETQPIEKQALTETTDNNETAAVQQQPKKKFLESIRVPLSNMLPKRLKSGYSNDLELGNNGPNTRAGLASMETLDDSQKDTTDCVQVNGDDGMETVKLDSNDEKDKEKSEETPKPASCLDSIRNYRCSIDDLAILTGVLVFLLIVGIILAFTLTTTPTIKVAPLRDGKYVSAVTSCGPVEGILEDGAFAFRGIPYALPPIDDRRWQPAQLIDSFENCWNGTFQAHNTTEHCWQFLANGSKAGIENCLTLDIVTPHVRYDNPLPVVVLIGTESLTGESPSKMRPSTRYARARDVIFVRPNFRVGIHGFLALDALSKTVHPPTSGNYGLSDIIAVLKWIQFNIVNFGGDAKSVTLFGHRAGATLVTALVTSHKLKDLYARAWVSSGAAIFPGESLVHSQLKNRKYMTDIDCEDVECLRSKTNKQLLDAIPSEWRRDWPDLPLRTENTTARHEWLVLDGDILKQHPADVWKADVGKLKFVIGTTAHESHSEKLFNKHVEWTPEIVRNHIEQSKIGELGLTDEALKLYPSTYQGLVSMISDIRTICPLLAMARTRETVPFYVVTQTSGQHNIADVDADVSAIFGRYESKTPEQRRYLSAMQQLFYHYVSHGEMNQYEQSLPVLDIGQDALPKYDYPNCNFWIKNDIVLRYARLD